MQIMKRLFRSILFLVTINSKLRTPATALNEFLFLLEANESGEFHSLDQLTFTSHIRVGVSQMFLPIPRFPKLFVLHLRHFYVLLFKGSGGFYCEQL